MKKSNRVNALEIFSDNIMKIGVFASSLLLTTTAVYIYSPVLGTNASDSANMTVETIVNPVASLALDTDSLVFNMTPSVEGAFSSQAITAIVDTNSIGGYELYFSSIDNETNLVNPNVSNVISSNFDGSVTSSSMTANTWGYSLDDTDFLKIPALNNHTKIKDIDHYPETNEKSTPVYIGAKVSSTLPSGTYSKRIIFSVLAHDTPAPPTMQTFSCNYIKNVGGTMVLEDTRDGSEYTVKKLADGKCWMMDDLHIENYTATSADSDVVSDFVITESNNRAHMNNTFEQSAVHIANGIGYYNWYTATAGEGTIALSQAGGEAEHSICPKNWKLPTSGYTDSDYEDLAEAYLSNRDIMIEEFNLSYTGYSYGGGLAAVNSFGTHTSATAEKDKVAYGLQISSTNNSATMGGGNTNIGFTIRCLARN